MNLDASNSELVKNSPKFQAGWSKKTKFGGWNRWTPKSPVSNVQLRRAPAIRWVDPKRPPAWLKMGGKLGQSSWKMGKRDEKLPLSQKNDRVFYWFSRGIWWKGTVCLRASSGKWTKIDGLLTWICWRGPTRKIGKNAQGFPADSPDDGSTNEKLKLKCAWPFGGQSLQKGGYVYIFIYNVYVCIYIYISWYDIYHDMIHTYHYIHMYTYRGIYITWYVYIIIYVILSCIRWWSKHQFCGEHPNIRALGRSSQQLLPWISWPLKSEKSMEHHLYRSNKIH